MTRVPKPPRRADADRGSARRAIRPVRNRSAHAAHGGRRRSAGQRPGSIGRAGGSFQSSGKFRCPEAPKNGLVSVDVFGRDTMLGARSAPSRPMVVGGSPGGRIPMSVPSAQAEAGAAPSMSRMPTRLSDARLEPLDQRLEILVVAGAKVPFVIDREFQIGGAATPGGCLRVDGCLDLSPSPASRPISKAGTRKAR